ncbi:ISL3 family transposase [Caloramator sp. mosi_1]|uniref:ISL3 family transposase n=1 Tax=Caloramator sp. mosi_1 TaxID=3023090 RepID=UPI002361DA38|nr:ISL3 family transposase [Caloramator sp. mosi_1]WDC85742.1 ISL3 family transposase [Caloramator sp. mosi_1]
MYTCPNCNSKVTRVHDYRIQRIKGIPLFFKHTFIILKKRRYRCNACGKRFYEHIEFLPRYHRITNRLAMFVINELSNEYSMTSVARKTNLSIDTIKRIFDNVSYSSPTNLPKIISIDEFKGNSSGSKYHCAIVDPVNHKILDIIKDRKEHILIDYFRKIKNRNSVTHFICDMWQPYIDLAKTYFKNAVIVIDKFHYIRQVIWAVEAVRKRIQRELSIKLRKYFKRNKKLILKRYGLLDTDSKLALQVMFSYNSELAIAHTLKEKLLSIIDASPSSNEARVLLKDWIKLAQNSGINEFKRCANTYIRYFNEICNSFDIPYTNACIEGFNNKIKVIKRIAFGYRNFDRFRNRILHCCNK